MELVQEYLTELERMASASEGFKNACTKAGVPPGVAVAGLAGSIFVIGFILQGYNLVFAFVTCIYPMWKSVLAVEDKKSEETNTWLCYWTLFGTIQIAELFIGFILYWIPYYSVIRLIFFIYLMLPQTGGARVIYNSLFKPLVHQHQKELEDLLSYADSMGDKLADQAASAAKDAAKNVDLNKAAAGVNKIREMTESSEAKKED